MIVRRYRDGRLVRARRLHRSTLRNDRNLVGLRIAGMLLSIDRFGLMLRTLRDAAGQQEAPDSPPFGDEPEAEPEAQEHVDGWDGAST